MFEGPLLNDMDEKNYLSWLMCPIWGGAYEASEESRELPAGLEMTREAGLPF